MVRNIFELCPLPENIDCVCVCVLKKPQVQKQSMAITAHRIATFAMKFTMQITTDTVTVNCVNVVFILCLCM